MHGQGAPRGQQPPFAGPLGQTGGREQGSQPASKAGAGSKEKPQPETHLVKDKKNKTDAGKLPWQTEEEYNAERREMRAKIRAQKEKEEFLDNEGTIKWLCSLGVINVCFICVPAFGNSWCYKQFVGIGIKTMQIRTSLFYIDVNVQCGKNWLEDKFCNGVVKKLNGVHSLQEATHIACAVNQALPGGTPCEIVSRLYGCSFIIFGTFLLAIIMNLCGVMFLSHYWYSKPLPAVRSWALCFFCGATIFVTSGLLFWVFISPDLEELPRAWTAQTAALIGNNLFAIKPAPGPKWGWSFIAACVVALLYVVQLALWGAWFVPHEKEEEAMDQETLARDHLEERLYALQQGLNPADMQQATGAGGFVPRQGQGPPGQMPASQMPTGQMPTGQMPAGQMQGRQMYPGDAMYPGQMDAMYPGQMPPGQMPAQGMGY
jgi:hypothetical protein